MLKRYLAQLHSPTITAQSTTTKQTTHSVDDRNQETSAVVPKGSRPRAVVKQCTSTTSDSAPAAADTDAAAKTRRLVQESTPKPQRREPSVERLCSPAGAPVAKASRAEWFARHTEAKVVEQAVKGYIMSDTHGIESTRHRCYNVQHDGHDCHVGLWGSDPDHAIDSLRARRMTFLRIDRPHKERAEEVFGQLALADDGAGLEPSQRRFMVNVEREPNQLLGVSTKGGVLDGDNGAAATDDDDDPDSPTLIDLGCVTNICAPDLADLKRGDIIEAAQGVRTITDGLVTPRQPTQPRARALGSLAHDDTTLNAIAVPRHMRMIRDCSDL